jgi:hypothetical protein
VCKTQLSGTLKHQGRELQGRPGNEITLVSPDIAQKLAQLLRIGDRGVVTSMWRWQATCPIIAVEKDKALISQGFSDFFDCLRTM